MTSIRKKERTTAVVLKDHELYIIERDLENGNYSDVDFNAAISALRKIRLARARVGRK